MMYLLYFLSTLGVLFILLLAAIAGVIAYDIWRGRWQKNINTHRTKDQEFED